MKKFKEWLEMVGTGIVAGNEKLSTNKTFNVWGADPNGNPYPSTSVSEPKKEKKKRKK